MSAGPARVALIGCGVHARTVLLPALTIAGGRLVSCFDPDPDRAAAVAGQFGLEPATSIEAATDAAECSIVAAPIDAHVDIVSALAARNVPTFVEKPCGSSVERLAALVADLAESPCPIQIGYMRRFSPVFRQVRQLARSWGRPLAMQLTASLGPIADLAVFMTDVAVHHLDLIRWLLGDPVDVQGVLNRMDTGWVVQAVLSGPNGTATLFLSSAGSWGTPTEELLIQSGDHLVRVRNCVEVTLLRSGRLDTADDKAGRLAEIGDCTAAPNFANPRLPNSSLYLQGYVPELTAFLRAVRMRAPMSPSPADALATLALADQVKALRTP